MDKFTSSFNEKPQVKRYSQEMIHCGHEENKGPRQIFPTYKQKATPFVGAVRLMSFSQVNNAPLFLARHWKFPFKNIDRVHCLKIRYLKHTQLPLGKQGGSPIYLRYRADLTGITWHRYFSCNLSWTWLGKRNVLTVTRGRRQGVSEPECNCTPFGYKQDTEVLEYRCNGHVIDRIPVLSQLKLRLKYRSLSFLCFRTSINYFAMWTV